MTIESLSALGIVTAAVVYMLAFVCHVIEWASLRGVTEPDERARTRSEAWGRMGVNLTVIGALSAGVGVVCRGVAAHRMPWGNMYEFVTTALFFVVIAHLVLVATKKVRWMGLGITLLLAVGNGLAATVFYVAVAPLVPQLHSVWFVIHIVAACLAAAALNVGGIASVMYLLCVRARNRAERTGRPITGFMTRMPSTDVVDTVAYRAHAIGFPIWTFTIAAGAVWAEYAWGRPWGWDPKETWSLVTWVVYAGYLHARATAGWKGAPAAIIAIIGLACFWFNFIGVNLVFHGLHSYAGI